MPIRQNDPFAPGLLSRLSGPVARIAILRASRIGDFLCATPAFRALKAALPDAQITLVGLPLLRGLAERSPFIDRFVPFPGFPGIAEQFFSARAATAFFSRMQAERFDLVLQMHGSGVHSNTAALLCGGRATAGFVRPDDGPGRLDAAIPYPGAGVHEIERLLAFVRFLGAQPNRRTPDRRTPDGRTPDGRRPDCYLRAGDHRAAARLLAPRPGPLIGVHVGANHAIKRWPVQRFAAVVRAIQSEFGGTVVSIGGPQEQGVARRLENEVRGPVANAAGYLPLPAMAAVIARLSLLLTNDSGPAHMAYALGTPSVTVFGGTDPAQWGPLNGERHRVIAAPVPCRPCAERPCAIGYRCLELAETESVLREARAAFQAAAQ